MLFRDTQTHTHKLGQKLCCEVVKGKIDVKLHVTCRTMYASLVGHQKVESLRSQLQTLGGQKEGLVNINLKEHENINHHRAGWLRASAFHENHQRHWASVP